jgi:hypothetical protein
LRTILHGWDADYVVVDEMIAFAADKNDARISGGDYILSPLLFEVAD